MRNTRLHWLFGVTILIFVGFYGVYNFLGIAIRKEFGVEAGGAGIFIFFYGFGFLVGTLNAGLIDRIGPGRCLFWCTAVLSLILAAIPHAIHSATLLGLTMFLWGVIQNGAFTSFTTALAKTHPTIRGRALSINTACVFLGASIGTVTMGMINAEFGFVVVGFACMMATATASILAEWKPIVPAL